MVDDLELLLRGAPVRDLVLDPHRARARLRRDLGPKLELRAEEDPLVHAAAHADPPRLAVDHKLDDGGGMFAIFPWTVRSISASSPTLFTNLSFPGPPANSRPQRTTHSLNPRATRGRRDSRG